MTDLAGPAVTVAGTAGNDANPDTAGAGGDVRSRRDLRPGRDADHRRHQRGPRGDRGSAAVEFVLVSVLVVGLALGVVQLAVDLHVRDVLTAAASEGARYGANADRGPADAADRSRQVIRQALAARFASDVSAAEVVSSGVPSIRVTVRSGLPLIWVWGPPGALVVHGDALKEGR